MAIPVKALQLNETVADQWFPLELLTPHAETYGEVFVELLMQPTPSGLERLMVNVPRARDLLGPHFDHKLPSKLTPCVVVTLDDEQQQSRPVVGSTRFPVFDDTAVFKFARSKLAGDVILTVKSGSATSAPVLGVVTLPLKGLQHDIPTRGW